MSAYASENQNCEIDGLTRYLLYVSSSFHFLPFIGLSLFYTQTRSLIFSSLPVNLVFYSLKRPPFVLPCFLHIAAQTQKASLAPAIIGGWQAEHLGPYWRTINALHFYSMSFPASTRSISHSSCSNLPTFVLQKPITFIFTLFAFTLVPITNLAGFWLLFNSGVPPLYLSHNFFSHHLSLWICKPEPMNCFYFLFPEFTYCVIRKPFAVSYHFLYQLIKIPCSQLSFQTSLYKIPNAFY